MFPQWECICPPMDTFLFHHVWHCGMFYLQICHLFVHKFIQLLLGLWIIKKKMLKNLVKKLEIQILFSSSLGLKGYYASYASFFSKQKNFDFLKKYWKNLHKIQWTQRRVNKTNLTIMTGLIESAKNRCWLQASSGFRDNLPKRSARILSDLRETSMHTNPLSLK